MLQLVVARGRGLPTSQGKPSEAVTSSVASVTAPSRASSAEHVTCVPNHPRVRLLVIFATNHRANLFNVNILN